MFWVILNWISDNNFSELYRYYPRRPSRVGTVFSGGYVFVCLSVCLFFHTISQNRCTYHHQPWPMLRYDIRYGIFIAYSKWKERKSIYIAPFYILCISRSAQAWITQLYLQIHHACLSTGKVRQSKTDVLPLCHATNHSDYWIYMRYTKDFYICMYLRALKSWRENQPNLAHGTKNEK